MLTFSLRRLKNDIAQIVAGYDGWQLDSVSVATDSQCNYRLTIVLHFDLEKEGAVDKYVNDCMRVGLPIINFLKRQGVIRNNADILHFMFLGDGGGRKLSPYEFFYHRDSVMRKPFKVERDVFAHADHVSPNLEGFSKKLDCSEGEL